MINEEKKRTNLQLPTLQAAKTPTPAWRPLSSKLCLIELYVVLSTAATNNKMKLKKKRGLAYQMAQLLIKWGQHHVIELISPLSSKYFE